MRRARRLQRIPRPAVQLGIVALFATSVLVAMPRLHTAAASCPAGAVACDSFGRTLSGTWGSADVGGAWNTSGPQYSVTPGAGTIVADSTTPSNFLASVSTQDVDLLTKITPPAATAPFIADGAAVRYVAATGSWYQLTTFDSTAANGGNYVVQLTRKPDNVAVRPDVDTGIAAGTPYWIRLQAVGASPTTLRWKIWADGSSEPAGWTDTGVDGNAAQQTAGGVGVVAFASSGTSPIAFNSITATVPPPLPIVACSVYDVACDSFNRTVSNAWGTADIGGAWNASGSRFSVTPGNGHITADSTAPTTVLTSLSIQDVDALALIAPAPINGSQFQDDGVTVRYSSAGGTWYQVSAFYNSGYNGGNYAVQLKRKPDNTLIRPEVDTSIPGGTPYWMRLEAQGVNPTTLRWKMWAAGSAEPAAWADTGTDATAAEQAAGSVGVIAFTDTGTSAISVQSVQVTSINPNPPPPASLTCPSQPVACDTYARTVSGGWGAADTGGAWAITGTPANWSVAPGTGTVSVGASSSELGVLGSVSVENVEVLEKVAVPRSTQANDDLASVVGRYRGAGAYYRVGVGQGSAGQMILRAQRADGTAIGSDVSTGIPAADGAAVWLRVQFQGDFPTAIRARAWLDGTAEPTTNWMLDTTDSDGPEQGAGAIGVRDANEDSSAAHTFLHSTYQAVGMSEPALCPSGVLVCDNFTRTVHDGWGLTLLGLLWDHGGPAYNVVPGRATIQVGSSSVNFLPLTLGVSADARLWVSPPAFGATGDAGIGIRHNILTGSYYEVSVSSPTARNGGNYAVQLRRMPENVAVGPVFNVNIPGGTGVWIRVQAIGTYPTTLHWKVWQDGEPQPSSWLASATDSNPPEQFLTGVGVEGGVSSGSATVAYSSISAGGLLP